MVHLGLTPVLVSRPTPLPSAIGLLNPCSACMFHWFYEHYTNLWLLWHCLMDRVSQRVGKRQVTLQIVAVQMQAPHISAIVRDCDRYTFTTARDGSCWTHICGGIPPTPLPSVIALLNQCNAYMSHRFYEHCTKLLLPSYWLHWHLRM